MMAPVRKLALAVALAAAAPSLVACTPPPPAAKRATVEAGTMPDGATWEGVYFSSLFGTLHLVPEGNLVQGRWVRPVKGEWGKLTGNANGNVLRFDWVEINDGLIGPNSKKAGKGYFVYSRPEGDNVDDVLKGEIGRGEDEVGTEWTALKQRNVKADLNAVQGAGAAEIGGGEWDANGTESGTPEEPAKTEE